MKCKTCGQVSQQWTTIVELAQRLSVCDETVRRLIKAGHIAAIKTGTGNQAEYRISEEAVADFVYERGVRSSVTGFERAAALRQYEMEVRELIKAGKVVEVCVGGAPSSLTHPMIRED